MAPPPVPPAFASRLPSQSSPRNPNRNLNSVLQDILLDLEDIFLKAVYNGDLRLVKKMVRALDDGEGRIAQKMGAVTHSSFGIGVLHFAALGGSLPMCRYLVEDLRMDVDDVCPAGETPLTFAIGFENVDVVRYLLDHGAHIEKLNEDGLTPLYVAAATGQCEIVEVLLSKGAHIDALSTGETALHAAAHGRHDNVMKILLDHCADHNKINFGDCTPLVSAIYARSLKCVKLLLEAGADVNCIGFETPLIVAAGIGLTDILKCLVLAGADPNVHDSFGRTPVEIAACYSTRKDVEILFPVTSRIPSVGDWSVDGIISYAKPVLPSKEVMLAVTKSEAREAYTNTDFLAAVEKYTKAMDLDPDDASLFSGRSLCWFQLDEGQKALMDAEACRRMRPDWPKACHLQGIALMLLKDYENACSALLDGLKLDPWNDHIEDDLRQAMEFLQTRHILKRSKVKDI